MGPKTVLLIEDDLHLQRFVAANLAAEGLRVLHAADGDRGLDLARRERPALVLVDLMLPGPSGWDVLAGLQASDLGLPTAVITAAAAAEDEERARTMGARDYLIKPLSAPELVQRVRLLLASPGGG